MVAELIDREFVTPDEQDVPRIQALQQFLSQRAPNSAKLVAPDGEALDIPAPVYHVLRQIVPLMAQGATIGLVPLHKELTTQEAAALLNVSRPSLIKLLDAGAIRYRRSEGGHRRVRFVDVMDYMRRRSGVRHSAFAEIAAIGQKYNAYDPDSPDLLFGIDEATDGRD